MTMPTPANNSGIRDNHTRGTVANSLTDTIRDGTRLSIVSAYFTIYAYDADSVGLGKTYDKLNDEIQGYTLSLFNPSFYVREEFKPRYEKQTGLPFTQAQREDYLIGMMKVNFLKRLESSVKSFEITMPRTIGKIEDLEKKIRNFQTAPAQSTERQTQIDFGDLNPGDDDDEELDEAQAVGGKYKYDLAQSTAPCVPARRSPTSSFATFSTSRPITAAI